MPNAECSNGDERALSCGVLQLGDQLQRCVQFLWEDVGDCSEELFCAPADTRTASCGLNLRGEVTEICGSNKWKTIGECQDDDTCVDGDTETDPCGKNGRGGIQRVCTTGQWVLQECVDIDVCVDDEVEVELCDSVGATEYTRQRVCVEGSWSDTWTECQVVLCDEGEIDVRGCGVEDRGVVRERCVGGQWASTNECEMRAEHVHINNTHTFLVAADGSLWVAGDDNSALSGRLMTEPEAATVLVREPFATRVFITSEDHIAVGPSHACIIQEGVVECWGDSSAGQLGVSSVQNSSRVPVRVPNVGGAVNPAVQVVVTPKVSCARMQDGDVRCWGENSTGGGVGASGRGVRAPVKPQGLPKAERLFAKEQMVCARVQGGDIYCWGDNLQSRGLLLGIGDVGVLPGGVGSKALVSPERVPALYRAGQQLVDLHLYRDNGCAQYSDGAVFCWGLNKNGEIGDGTTSRSTAPKQVIAPGNVSATSLQTDRHRRCAQMTGGSILCWGRQALGDQNARLIPNAGERVLSPALTPRFSETDFTVESLGVANESACAVHNDEVVRCTGVTRTGSFGRGALNLSNGPAAPMLAPELLVAP